MFDIVRLNVRSETNGVGVVESLARILKVYPRFKFEALVNTGTPCKLPSAVTYTPGGNSPAKNLYVTLPPAGSCAFSCNL